MPGGSPKPRSGRLGIRRPAQHLGGRTAASRERGRRLPRPSPSPSEPQRGTPLPGRSWRVRRAVLTQRQAAGGAHGRPEAVHLRVLLAVRLPEHLALHDLLEPGPRLLGHGGGGTAMKTGNGGDSGGDNAESRGLGQSTGLQRETELARAPLAGHPAWPRPLRTLRPPQATPPRAPPLRDVILRRAASKRSARRGRGRGHAGLRRRSGSGSPPAPAAPSGRTQRGVPGVGPPAILYSIIYY
jgi:hypothetical protein